MQACAQTFKRGVGVEGVGERSLGILQRGGENLKKILIWGPKLGVQIRFLVKNCMNLK